MVSERQADFEASSDPTMSASEEVLSSAPRSFYRRDLLSKIKEDEAFWIQGILLNDGDSQDKWLIDDGSAVGRINTVAFMEENDMPVLQPGMLIEITGRSVTPGEVGLPDSDLPVLSVHSFCTEVNDIADAEICFNSMLYDIWKTR